MDDYNFVLLVGCSIVQTVFLQLIKKMKIVFLLVFTITLQLCCVHPLFARQVPTFRGFPVYPAEEIGTITASDQGDVAFDLPLPTREQMLLQVAELNPHKTQVADTKKITLEFDIAKNYIQRNAALLGWQIVSVDETWGKDTQEMEFMNKNDPSNRVSVVIWTGSISVRYEGVYVRPADKWGMITYRFYVRDK